MRTALEGRDSRLRAELMESATRAQRTEGAPDMEFTAELWESIGAIYAAILRHPFINGLTDGSLPHENFKFYAVQDALYLREFARALSITGARAPRDEWIIMFNEHAAGRPKVQPTVPEGFFLGFRRIPGPAAATPL